MRGNGFSLVELLMIVSIMGIVAALGTLQFNQYTTKTGMERQIRGIYADLMKARSEALMQKVNRSFTITGTQFKIYPSTNGSGTPLEQTTFKYPVTFNNSSSLSFDSRGMASGAKAICVEPAGTASIDSILITKTMIQLGKRSGGSCQSGNIDAR